MGQTPASEVRHLRERFGCLWQASMDGVIIVSPEGLVEESNRAFRDLVGHDKETLRTLHLWELDESGRELTEERLRRVAAEGCYRFETRLRSSNAGSRDVAVNAAFLENEGGRFMAVLKDLTPGRSTETRLNELEQRLAELTRELERSTAELESFASGVSHDLQEPLRAVAGYLQLLMTRNAGALDEESLDFMRRAVEGAGRMQELIRDLLTVARAGARGAEMQRFPLRSVVDVVLKDLWQAIAECDAEVEIGTLPQVHADRQQVRQLIQNLVSNAIKFRAGPRPRVRISAHEGPAEWRISVEDDGLGIDPKHAKRVFEVFSRLHTREAFEGNGIGLTVCRRVAERHGGRIWVESNEGQGSTFHVTLARPEPNDRRP